RVDRPPADRGRSHRGGELPARRVGARPLRPPRGPRTGRLRSIPPVLSRFCRSPGFEVRTARQEGTGGREGRTGTGGRKRASGRRSRLVGRPAPRSRTNTGSSRSGGGGLRSITHSAARGAPT